MKNETTCILKDTQKRWKKQLTEEGMLYLYAMTGFGKTTQALSFAQREYQEWERFGASKSDFFDKVQALADGCDGKRGKYLVILDDLQWIHAEVDRQCLFDLLLRLRKNRRFHLFLLSRAPVPAFLKPFQVTRQMSVENQEALRFDEKMARELLRTYPLLEREPELWQQKTAKASVELANGYVLGLNVFFQHLEKYLQEPETAVSLAVQDVQDYLSIHLFGGWSNARIDAAVRLSVYEQFNLAMAEDQLEQHADAVLKDFLEVGSFLQFKAPDTYRFVSFFREFLEAQLKKKPREEWQPIYEKAAFYYEGQRDFQQALRCFKQLGRQDKIAELVVLLSENADGSALVHIAQEYLDQLPSEWEKKEPRLLGARVMLAAYRMQTGECLALLERLKRMAEEEKGRIESGDAMAAYVRTVIACPYDTAERLRENMIFFASYVKKNGFQLKNIMPTGNMPSMINGGLDLLPWDKNKKLIYPIVKAAAELLMGKEAIGIADASMGEILYEQNQLTNAMAYLTRALSAASHRGSIRVQYAVTGVMARLFLSEGQTDTSKEILKNLQQGIEKEHFYELLPNLHASFICCALLNQDTLSMEEWMREEAPDEHEVFYITMRFQLLVKARVYTAQGKYMGALYILNLLEEFASLYERTYFYIDVLVLKAMILYRNGESWSDTLLAAVKKAREYNLVRIFADQGAALLPLWKQIDWQQEGIQWEKLPVITREMKRMARLYPNYLKAARQTEKLSQKELEVLALMAEGCSNSQMAELRSISLGTVKFHVANIMKKLGADNRTVAVKIAQEEGLL